MPQFWPPAERVERGSFVTANPPTAIVFGTPFASPPELTLTLVVTGTDAFTTVTAFSSAGFTAGALLRAASAWQAGYTMYWTARGI